LPLLMAAILLILCLPGPVLAASAEITIHYRRDDGGYDPWNIWAWPEGGEGAAYPFTDEDAYGKIAVIELPDVQDRIGFIVRTDAWEKDVAEDRFIDLAQGSEIWVLTGESAFTYEAPEGFAAEVTEYPSLAVTIHRNRYDGAYDSEQVSLEGDIAAEKAGSDDFGAVYTVTMQNVNSSQKLALSFSAGDTAQTYELSLSQVPEGASSMEVYAMQTETRLSYNEAPEVDISVKEALIDGPTELRVGLTYPAKRADGDQGFSVTDANGNEVAIMAVTAADTPNLEVGYVEAFTLVTETPLDLSKAYTVSKEGYNGKTAGVGNYFTSEGFDEMYQFNGELGALYTKEQTTFRLWAPTAASASLNLYPTGDGSDATETFAMTQAGNGVWEAEKTGDLNGVYYTYTVNVNGQENEAVDPYAKAAGVNGRRGMVIDLSATNPEGWDADARPPLENSNDAVIYELHVRDFSTADSSGMVNKGKYLAFTETGTTNADGLATGVDHLVELGVTHVHLLPVFDHRSIDETRLEDNRFNWGYDPENYNLPEGSYSTDPTDGFTRIGEFKQMVEALHAKGLRVVMDVVYNHTGATADSNLNKLVPNYYYRQNAAGGFANGSACGNETASDRSMVRKLIVDSVIYWATEYHIDGFRFDLMGLHDLDTMNAVRAALDEIDPSIMTYGEGWHAGGTPLSLLKQAVKANAKQLDPRIAMFSDDIRDGIKGSVFDAAQTGFVSGSYGRKEDIKFGAAGSVDHPQIDYSRVSSSKLPWAAAPSQTITYASAHDNLSLWDKLTASQPSADEADLLAMNKLSALIVLTSQGIPFFQAGEEFARSKGGDENSYQSPDSVNQLKWENKTKYNDLFEYYKGLIALRRSHAAFRFTTAEQVAQNISFLDTEPQVMAYVLEGESVGDGTFIVAVNADNKERTLALPKDGWTILADGAKAGTESLGTVGREVTLGAKSGVVLQLGAIETVATEPESSEPPVSPAPPAVSPENTDNADTTESGGFPWLSVVLGCVGAIVLGAVLWFFVKKKKA
jgi:pullulanase